MGEQAEGKKAGADNWLERCGGARNCHELSEFYASLENLTED